MKKLLCCLLATAMTACLLFAGCGQNSSAVSGSDGASVENTAEVVSVSAAENAAVEQSAPDNAAEAESAAEDADAMNRIPEDYSIQDTDAERLIAADGMEEGQNGAWCVVDVYYQNDEDAAAGAGLLEDPQKVLDELGMRYPEAWAVKVLASVRAEGDTGAYAGGSVTLRFPEINGSGRICAIGYTDGQWVRGVISEATNDYADARFETLPTLAAILYKPDGEGFRSPNGGSYIGEEGRILETADWPFEYQDEYWCTVDQEYQTEEDKEAVDKLMENPAACIKEFVDGDGTDWKLVLAVDVRLEGNLDKYEGEPVTVAFPEVRTDQQVIVLHFTDGEWHEELDKYVVDDYIGVRFTSLSPVAFFVQQK